MTPRNPYESKNVGSDGEAPAVPSLTSGWGIKGIAVGHAIASIAVIALIITAWNPSDLYEALPWMLVFVVLVVMSVGLWRRRRWTKPVMLVVHGTMAFVSILAAPACALFLLFVPAKGIALVHVFVIYGLIFSLVVGSLSGITVWYMVKRTA